MRPASDGRPRTRPGSNVGSEKKIERLSGPALNDLAPDSA